MTEQLALIPDPGEPRHPRVPAPAVEESWLDHVTGWLDYIPGWAWAIALTTLTLLAIVSMPFARSQAFKAGRRAAGKADGDNAAKGTALFVAAMGPAAFFWLAVLAGSFRGLAGFGRDTLHWTSGWEYLVPLTLDGIAISFGFLAFRSVKIGRSPERAQRVVWATALASALINYGHEISVGGSKLGGAYLALLSVLGMLIFHEFLDQFGEGAAYVQRVNPKFGLRWITWPSNTVCAWIAWRNYPPTPLPADATDTQKRWWGSINHAVAHLSTVRRAKRIARLNAALADVALAQPWWMRYTPWIRVRQLDAALTAQQAEMTEMAVRLDQVAADFEAEQRRADAETRRAEQAAENARVALAEKQAAETKVAEAYRQAQQTRSDLEAELARLRTETTNIVHRTESIADRRVTAAQTDLENTAARLDQMEQRWIDAKQEAALLGQKLSDAMAETDSAHRTAERAEQEAASLRTALTTATETHRTALAETIGRLQAEMAEKEARLRAEMSTVKLSDYRTGERSRSHTARRSGSAEVRSGASNAPSMSDGEAVQALLRAHPEPNYPWKQSEVRDVTGAGFGRIPRLLTALAEHHRSVAVEKRRSQRSGEPESGAVTETHTAGQAETTTEDVNLSADAERVEIGA